MALRTRQKDQTFIRIKEGKFFLSSDKDFTTPYDELEGIITDLYLKNETYNNAPLEKLYLKLFDGKETYVVGVPFDSAYTTSLVTFLKNADLSKPLSLFLKQNEIKDSDSKRTTFLVKQGTSFLKAFYTKENPNGLPPMVQKRNGKWDKDDMMDFIKDVIEKELAPIAQKNVTEKPMIEYETADQEKYDNTVSTTKLPWDSDDDSTDDLPF